MCIISGDAIKMLLQLCCFILAMPSCQPARSSWFIKFGIQKEVRLLAYNRDFDETGQFHCQQININFNRVCRNWVVKCIVIRRNGQWETIQNDDVTDDSEMDRKRENNYICNDQQQIAFVIRIQCLWRKLNYKEFFAVMPKTEHYTLVDVYSCLKKRNEYSCVIVT